MEQIVKTLFEKQDLAYRDFHSRLMPGIDKETVIGVRTPELRKLAKEIYGTPEAEKFLNELPHKYYEENNLHAFLIEQIKDYDECIAQLERFLPFVDNWATCDMMRPKILKKHLSELKAKCFEWIESDRVYTVRFAIETLMLYFLDEHFEQEIAEKIAAIKSDEYYVIMMVAWYFATALAKQYDCVLPYLTQKKLDSRVHNKAVQKARESYRITPEQKQYLHTLVRNG